MEFPRISNSVRIQVICALSLVIFFLCVFLYCYYTPVLANLVGECFCLVILLTAIRLLIMWIRTGPVPTCFLVTRRIVLPVNGCIGSLSRRESLEVSHCIQKYRRACCIDMLGRKILIDLRLQSDGSCTYTAVEGTDQITDLEIRDMLSSCARFKNRGIYMRRSIGFLAVCTARCQFVNNRAYILTLRTMMKGRRHQLLEYNHVSSGEGVCQC